LIAASAGSAAAEEGALRTGSGQIAVTSIEITVPDSARLSGRAPVLMLEGEEGPKLSAWLAGFVLSLLHETMVGAFDALGDAEGGGEGAPSAAWEQQVDYEVVHAGSRFVSLLFTDQSHTGGVHGNIGYHSFLLVRGPGGWREAALADLLLSGSGPSDRLSGLLLGGLRERGAMWVTNGSIKELSVDQMRVFTATQRALTFHFAPYEVGPYAEGPYEVQIPLAALPGVLRENALTLLQEE